MTLTTHTDRQFFFHECEGNSAASVMIRAGLMRSFVYDACRCQGLENQVVVREEHAIPVGEGFVPHEWHKNRSGYCVWRMLEHDGFELLYRVEQAPDLRPDDAGPITLPIVSLRKNL